MKKKTKMLLALSIVFICGCGGLVLLVHWAYTYESDLVPVELDVYQDLSPVCKGEGVPEARAFDPDADIHPTIVMTEDGKYWKSRFGLQGYAGDGWAATSVSETEIVICIGEEKGRELYCGQYRYLGQLSRTATIHLARTGEAVFSDYLFKANSCGSQWHEHGKEYELSAIYKWYIYRLDFVEDYYRRHIPSKE
jgi:hypothetical protein